MNGINEEELPIIEATDPTMSDAATSDSDAATSEEIETIPMDSEWYKVATLGMKKSSFDESRLPSDLDRQVTLLNNTVLHLAAKSGQVDFVRIILKKFPSLILRQNSRGNTPLHMAAEAGQAEIVYQLLNYSSEVDGDIENKKDAEGLKHLMMMKNIKGDTALHQAIRYHHVLIAFSMLPTIYPHKGDNDYSDLLNSANNAGETPLYLAANEGLVVLVFCILTRVPSASFSGPNGRTALYAAVINDDSDTTDILLRHRPDIIKETKDEKGWSPLHYAAFVGSRNTGKQLIRSDKSIAYLRDKEGASALHIAATKGHLPIIRDIISLYPDCSEMVDIRGRNTLHFAVESGKVQFVYKLMKDYDSFGYLINEADNEGNTPLHLAAITHKFLIVELLIDRRGVDKKAMNKEKQTIYDILGREDSNIIFHAETGDYFSYEKLLDKTKLWLDIANPKQKKEKTVKQEEVHRKGQSLTDDFERQRNDNHLLVAALIATVTFTAGFTMPGGFEDDGKDEGMAILSRKAAFMAFLVADTLALSFSTAAVYFHFRKMYFQHKKINHLFSMFAATLTELAMYAMSVAFGTGTYVVLPPLRGLSLTVCLFASSFWFLLFLMVRVILLWERMLSLYRWMTFGYDRIKRKLYRRIQYGF